MGITLKRESENSEVAKIGRGALKQKGIKQGLDVYVVVVLEEH